MFENIKESKKQKYIEKLLDRADCSSPSLKQPKKAIAARKDRNDTKNNPQYKMELPKTQRKEDIKNSNKVETLIPATKHDLRQPAVEIERIAPRKAGFPHEKSFPNIISDISTEPTAQRHQQGNKALHEGMPISVIIENRNRNRRVGFMGERSGGRKKINSHENNNNGLMDKKFYQRYRRLHTEWTNSPMVGLKGDHITIDPYP